MIGGTHHETFYIIFSFGHTFQPVQAGAQELVLYFPFEGSGDTVDDKSGKNNHGKFDNGKAKRVASKDKPFGKAMEFDKSRIILQDNKSLSGDIKILPLCIVVAAAVVKFLV